ncbi:hypothetical protein ACTA71_011160 [Dictyostelium dimigraforme]
MEFIHKIEFKQYKVLSKYINAVAKKYALNNVSNKYGKDEVVILIGKLLDKQKKWNNYWQAWLIALVINFAAFGLLCFLVLIDAIPYLTKLMAQVYDMFITEAEPKMSPEEIYKEAERILEIAKGSKKENPGFFKKLVFGKFVIMEENVKAIATVNTYR